MFGGFTEGDFEAYAERKWRSNAFSLERLAVKEKLIELGRALGPSAVAADGCPLHCEPSTEHPALWNQKCVDAQHIFFSRDLDTRKELDRIIERSRSLASLIEDPSPQRSHIVLAVSIHFAQLSIALRLHADAAVDCQNLEQLTCSDELSAQLAQRLRRLEAPFEVAVGPRTVAAAAIDASTIAGLTAELRRPLSPGQSRWLTIARRIPRQEVIALGEKVLDEIRAALRCLLPLFHMIAWAPDNDHIGLRQSMKEEAEAKQHRGLAKHDRVRVVAGVFTGRVGVVQQLESRGTLKVLVGKIPVLLAAYEVEKV